MCPYITIIRINNTSETRAKYASNIIARKLDRNEQLSAINM